MKGDKERELLRLQLSSRDFEDARDFIDAAKKHEASSIEYSALVMAAIICYARPFTTNEVGSSRATVAPTLILHDPASVLGAHCELDKRIKRMRNKTVAHSEWSHNPVQLVPVISGIGFCGRRWSLLEESIDLDAFREMTEAMRWHCINQIILIGGPSSAVR